jgi:site-specific DNA recombinase
MIAAIYARRSKEQDNAEDETKSVNRQVENARVFATAKGWTVLDEHIYIDDGVSGASTLARLRAKARMLSVITTAKTPPFDVLICQAPDRLSRRDGDESFSELKTIAKAGVQIYFYSDGSCFQFGDFASNALGFLRAEVAAEYRRAVSKKTTESHLQKARLGHHIGGRRFGYANISVDKHRDLAINPNEAAVVRQLFDLCATGTGYTRIAKTLNAARIPSPRPQKGHPAGWSPSTVRAILHNDLYRGLLVTFKTKERDASGDVAPTRRPASEWVHVSREDLRIVTDDQWNAAHSRLSRVRLTMTTTGGPRPIVRRDIGSKYLLSGFARCATCGWSMTVVTRSHGTRRQAFLACLSHYKRGPHVCPNGQIVPLDRADAAVLAALKADALDPSVVSTIVNMVFERLAPSNLDSKLAAFERELHDTEGAIANLARAIERAPDLDPLIAQMRERQQERTRLQQDIASARALRQVQLDSTRIEEEVQTAVSNWRETLATAAVEGGRALLREVLSGPLVFQPTPEGYTFRGPVILGGLIAGAVNDGVQQAGAHKVSSPTGSVVSYLSTFIGFWRSDRRAA